MELIELPNVGPELSKTLNHVEVYDLKELNALGAEMTILRMKSQLIPECGAEPREFFDGLPKLMIKEYLCV